MALDNFYDKYLDNMDPRVEDWILMSSIMYPIAINLVYFLVFYAIAPELMKNRDPFSRDSVAKFLRIYNPVFTALNGLFAFIVSMDIYRGDYSLVCQPTDYNGGDLENEMASLMWAFHVIKIVEMIDTVILMVTKKERWSANSILHVYHHSTMVIVTWIAAKFAPGGSSAFVAVLNSYVHVLMYMYRIAKGTNTMGKRMNYQIWLTQVQIVQFITVGVMCGLTIWSSCNYPKWLSWGLMVYVGTFLLWMIPLFHYQFPRRTNRRG